MKITWKATNNNIEVGDIVICEDNIPYLLIHKECEPRDWPYIFVNLETCEYENGFMTIDHVNKHNKVKSTSGTIIKVIKNKNIKIGEIDTEGEYEG